MAAYTSAGSGNWSAAGTWTTTPPTGGPGDGDTASIATGHTVTVDSVAGAAGNGIVTVGTDSGSAVTLAGASSTLNFAAGTTLKLKGNLTGSGSAWQYMTMSAGSTLAFYPPASTTFYMNMQVAHVIVCNGTSANHCTITVDKSRGSGIGNAYMTQSGDGAGSGINIATYTDFSNFGNSTTSGVITKPWTTGYGPGLTITNCTFTACSYLATASTVGGWDHQCTFQNNVFTNSVTNSQSGYSTSFFWTINNATYSGTYTRLIDSNVFDTGAVFGGNQPTITNNIILNGVCVAATSVWTNISQFSNNFISNPGSSGNQATLYGNCKNTYIYAPSGLSNPHYLGFVASGTIAVTGLIFESGATSSGGLGDCIFPHGSTLLVQNCIVLPDGTGHTSGKMVSDLQTSTTIVTAEHNTYFAGPTNSDANSSIAGLGESGGGQYTGCIASCRANLCWNATSSTGCLAAFDMTSGHGSLNNVTVAAYNGFWNPTTGSSDINGTTTPTQGYGGLYTSQAAFPSTSGTSGIGYADIAGNPGFVDSTRCLATWGGTAAGGGVATAAAAMATLAANPALIGQATTGLLAWVRAGFRPTNSAFEATGWSADTSTADAAGNAWPGASPGFGAMAYYAGTGSPTSFPCAMLLGL